MESSLLQATAMLQRVAMRKGKKLEDFNIHEGMPTILRADSTFSAILHSLEPLYRFQNTSVAELFCCTFPFHLLTKH